MLIIHLMSREVAKPILLVFSDFYEIVRFIIERPELFQRLAQTFWPGPLTLIGKAASELPDEITAGTETVGVRLPDDDNMRLLLRKCGGALTATSANRSDEVPAESAEDVKKYFGSAIDLIVDGGPSRINRPSTVVDVTDA